MSYSYYILIRPCLILDKRYLIYKASYSISHFPKHQIFKSLGFRSITMSSDMLGRSQKYPKTYADVFKDDMEQLSPKALQEEINYMSNFTLNEVFKRQEFALRDVTVRRRKAEFANIKRKYFKEHQPSLLTWEMKDQIKSLHASDPILWTPQNLAYAFPSSESEVRKIIKDTRRCSAQYIENYNRTVLENWQQCSKNNQLGNVTLLKKTVEKRISEVTEKSTLPAVPLGTSQAVVEFLSGLKFTEEADMEMGSFMEEYQKSTRKFRRKYPFKQTFKSILTKYQEDVKNLKQLESGVHEESVKEKVDISPCTDLTLILPKRELYINETYVKINCNHEPGIRPLRKREERHITYDVFIKKKMKNLKSSP